MNDRITIVHQNFLERVSQGNFPLPISNRASSIISKKTSLTKALALNIFKSSIVSRHLDRASYAMQAKGHGFYTISSSGHEAMAAIAAACLPSDMAFLHYRDCAFFLQRALQVDEQYPIKDLLASFAASTDDPIAGGRHKVLGSKKLFIPPQTSTIASHLPKAVGSAYSIYLANRLHHQGRVLEHDGVIVCSFGDASFNHASAQTAFNGTLWASSHGIPMPLLFICEDNNIGISTPTPHHWIKNNMHNRKGMRYLSCNGLDFHETFECAQEGVAFARRHRCPVFLHMHCVRLYGHAGSDIQTAYLSQKQIEQTESNDPLLHSARIMLENQWLTQKQIIALYQQIDIEICNIASNAGQWPRLKTSQEVQANIIPKVTSLRPTKPYIKSNHISDTNLTGNNNILIKKPQHMARLLNWAMHDLMHTYQEIILAGEDIGPKGGVYHVTAKLYETFGANRVINTLLDEQTILGLAIGLAHNGFIPICEIQFLAYLHNAEDQLRGEAATLSFFSQSQFTNPMIIRIAGLGYQKGFGGHFHNDNSIAVLRDIPGIIIACPSNGYDSVLMLREAVRLAHEQQRIVVFLEPIALYMTRDLYDPKDGAWSFLYPQLQDNASIEFGKIGQLGNGTDLAIITYANGVYLSKKAQKILTTEHNIQTRIIDLRWLAPINEDAVLQAIKQCSRVLIVDECRKTGSISEALMTLLCEKSSCTKIARLTADDSFIALGPASTLTLPSCKSIVHEACKLMRGKN